MEIEPRAGGEPGGADVRRLLVQASRQISATKFFKMNAPQLNAVRNVVGGHSSIVAGEYAINHVDSESDARLDLRADRSGKRTGVTFEFASEIVALGLIAHRGQQSVRDYMKQLFELMFEGFKSFSSAMAVLTVEYLIPRSKDRTYDQFRRIQGGTPKEPDRLIKPRATNCNSLQPADDHQSAGGLLSTG